MSKGWQKRPKLDREGAETIAVQALGFLAGEPQRFVRFLTLTGLTIEDVRARAGTADLLAAVLSHLTSDESLLLTFTAETHVAPDAIAPALALLQGHQPV
jgi:Protein of unknown function (DUF3572)